jgi:hypothetical protein
MTTAYEFGCKFAVSVPAISEGTGDIVAKFDVNSLVESLRKVPNLVHADEPGFANSFTNPTTKEMLWRAGAVLPLGLSAAGLWALGSGRNDIKPLPPKQPVGKKKKLAPVVKAADWQTTLQNFKAQLPGLHPVDTAVGAVGGAALGGLYDVLRGNSGKLAPNKRWKSTARRVLGGALLGGSAANLAGDRARRYISNTLIPIGYGAERTDSVLKPTADKLWRGAVLDQPAYDVNELKFLRINDTQLDARRELMRRTFGVHANNPLTDWWQKNKGGYYSINEQHPQYADRVRSVFGPGQQDATRTLYGLTQNPEEFLRKWNTTPDASQATTHDFAAGRQISGNQQIPYAPHDPLGAQGYDAQILDRFDLTPNKAETKFLKNWVQNKVLRKDPYFSSRPLAPGALKDFDYVGGGADTNADLAKSVGARWIWDRILSEEQPWVSQKFTLRPNTDGEKAIAENKVPLKWQLQFLRDNGTPTAPPLQTNDDVRDWVANDPYNVDPSVLKVLEAIEAAKKNKEKKSADNAINWGALLAGAARGGVAGSALGGLHGLISPGQEEIYDEHGQSVGTKQRNRFAAGLRGAFWGGLGGAGLGAGADYVAPGVTKSIHDFGRRMYTGKTQPELNKQDTVARMPWQKYQVQKAIDARFKHMRENPTRLPPPKYTPPAYPRMELEPEPWETARTMTPDEIAHSEDANL